MKKLLNNLWVSVRLLWFSFIHKRTITVTRFEDGRNYVSVSYTRFRKHRNKQYIRLTLNGSSFTLHDANNRNLKPDLIEAACVYAAEMYEKFYDNEMRDIKRDYILEVRDV